MGNNINISEMIQSLSLNGVQQIDIARTLEYNMIITWTKKDLKFNDIINSISDYVNSVKLIRLDHHSSNHKAVLLVSPKENYSPDDLIVDLRDLDDALKVSFYESKTSW